VSTGAGTVVAADVASLLTMAGGLTNTFNTTTRTTMTAYVPYSVTLQLSYNQDVRMGDTVSVNGVTYIVTGLHTEDIGLVGQSVDVAKVTVPA
jgi:hypothetical protein